MINRHGKLRGKSDWQRNGESLCFMGLLDFISKAFLLKACLQFYHIDNISIVNDTFISIL